MLLIAELKRVVFEIHARSIETRGLFTAIQDQMIKKAFVPQIDAVDR